MNSSPEPAQSQQPSAQPTDPTADPVADRAPGQAPAGVAAEGPPIAGAAPSGLALEGYGAGGGFELAHPSGPGTPERRGGLFGFRAERRRSWRRTGVVTGSVALAIFVLGAPLGVLWHVIAPGTPVIDAGQAGFLVNDPSPEEFIAADGWFTLLGLGFGLIVAIVAWLVLRRDRGPFLLLGIVIGTLAAGFLSAPWVGQLLGRGAYQSWRDTATQGATYLAPPELHSLGPSLVPGFIAAIALTLLAGWSNDPDLEQPGAKPGYGPNEAAANEAEAAEAQPG